MFRYFVTFMTLIAMLLHAGFGCCWHHAHADHEVSLASAGQSEQVSPSNAGCCHHCGHRHSSSTADEDSDPQGPVSGSEDQPSHHDDCSGATCQYLLADVLKAPSPAEGHATLDGLFLEPLQIGPKVAGQSGDCWKADAALSEAQRPKLRAVTQVWLI
jgi:hypothetical protein